MEIKDGPISHNEVLDTLLYQINQAHAQTDPSDMSPEAGQQLKRVADALQIAYRALGGETEPCEITNDTMITGAEWREFYKHNWPKNFYIDDVGIDFEDERGNYILPDDGLYRLGDFGMMGYQGPPCDEYKSIHLYSIAPFYAKFRNNNGDRTTMAFSIERGKRQELFEKATSLGATPIG